MANIITPGVTEFEREDLVTDERFNLMVAELAAKIIAEGGAGALKSEDVINTLVSTEIAKPLSANQGKVLKGLIDDNGSAIGQISDERGYVTAKPVLDFNLAIENGKYAAYDALHAPILGGYTFVFNVTKEATGVISQIAHCVLGAPAGRMFIRHLWGTWSDWEEVATTEKYIMQASDMRNGWILGHGNTLQKIGNRVFARFTISSGATAVNNVACNVPVGFRPSAETFITVKGNFALSDNPVNQFMAVFPDGNMQIKYIESKVNMFIETSWEV